MLSASATDSYIKRVELRRMNVIVNVNVSVQVKATKWIYTIGLRTEFSI